MTDTAISPFTLKVLEALREAHPEPVSEKELAARVGTRWIARHIEALNRTKGIKLGYELVEDERHHCIVVDVERDAGERRAAMLEESGPASAEASRAGASVPLSADPNVSSAEEKNSTSTKDGRDRQVRGAGSGNQVLNLRSGVTPTLAAADYATGPPSSTPDGQLFSLPSTPHYDLEAA